MSVSRRGFLTYMGMGAYGALTAAGAPAAGPAGPAAERGGGPGFFRPIRPSTEDRLILPDGFCCDTLCKWDDPLGRDGPLGAERFGFNNDFLAYFPIDALEGGSSSREGLLFVSHEYPNPLFVSGYTGGTKTAAQVTREKLCVGGSVLHVVCREGRWAVQPGSRYTRRLTALYPTIPLTGPARRRVPHGVGTLANCSGGRTPWMTALSCEENFQDYNAAGAFGYRWSDVPGAAIDERQYGWVVEIDPFDRLPTVKHSALGRFAHENCACSFGRRGRLVVYMGDDARDQFLYKYVSAGPYRASAPRADKQRLLEEGTLYVADFLRGKWVPLDWARNLELRVAGFRDQGDVLVRTREAAAVAGATPLDRPEDCEVHPRDGSVYVALTNNSRHGNFYGQIVRLLEDGDDHESEAFRYEVFFAGGPQSGLACPDNLAFDRDGNLWVACDISSEYVTQGCYEPFGNNGLFMVPTRGPSAGDAFQFASGPVECELTGQWFTEDEGTMFLAVQHPGEESPPHGPPTSHWPDGGDAVPRPAVVAITGFRR